MSLKIKYTPLYGVGPDDPVCGLLELDGARLLLDCGCSPNPDSRQLDTLARYIPAHLLRRRAPGRQSQTQYPLRQCALYRAPTISRAEATGTAGAATQR